MLSVYYLVVVMAMSSGDGVALTSIKVPQKSLNECQQNALLFKASDRVDVVSKTCMTGVLAN